ncbi:4Fe-4S dicluster domain-containing protein [Bacteroidota bacterium]
MRLALLKKIRVVISILFFVFTTILFLDFSFSLPSEISGTVLYLQFVPSLVKFIKFAGFTSFGFLVILILTLLFGRVYCSSICPLGTFQDFISYISTKFHKRKKRKYHFLEANDWLRVSLLILPFVFLLFGSIFVLNLLDPYSNFGRIITGLLRPIFLGVNNLVAFTLESMNVYLLYPVEFKGLDIMILIIPILILGLVLWLSFTKGRLYCNTVCPVGTLLGMLSRISLFKIAVNEINCSGCGACERVCKSSCIKSDEKFIDFSRCVSCFNCFNVCPTNGLKYEFIINRKKELPKVEIDNSKRDFITSLLVYSFGFTTLAKAQKQVEVYTENTVPVIRTNPISPPGSKSVDYFTDACTACHLCVSACPTQVLQPSFLEYGFLGMLQPRMDNKSGFCNFECKICGDVCPSGAILPVELENKKLIQIGKVKFIKENCVVETQGTDCGACSEHCPTKAVKMEPYIHPKFATPNLRIPVTDNEICVGCGACEFACPTKPYKAIYVESNPIHQTAKKPVEEKLEPVDTEEDFPF